MVRIASYLGLADIVDSFLRRDSSDTLHRLSPNATKQHYSALRKLGVRVNSLSCWMNRMRTLEAFCFPVSMT